VPGGLGGRGRHLRQRVRKMRKAERRDKEGLVWAPADQKGGGFAMVLTRRKVVTYQGGSGEKDSAFLLPKKNRKRTESLLVI